MQEIQKYVPILKNVVKKSSYHSKPDLSQHLYCFLVSRKELLNSIPDDEGFKLAKTILSNEAIRFCVYNGRRENYNVDVFSKCDSSYDETDETSSSHINLKENNLCHEFDCLKNIHFRDLLKVISKFKLILSNDVERRYIDECLRPSDGLKQYWETIKSKHSRFKNYKFIPPFTVCRFINMDNNHFLRFRKKAINYLKKFDIIVN